MIIKLCKLNYVLSNPKEYIYEQTLEGKENTWDIKMGLTQFLALTPHCVKYVYYRTAVNHHQQNYYVISDELHGPVFRPVGSRLLAIKLYKVKITVASSFLYD